MCTGLKYVQMREGDFAAIYGDNSQVNRKLMILIDGQLSLRVPSPPEVIISIIDQMIADLDKKEADKQAKLEIQNQDDLIQEEDESNEENSMEVTNSHLNTGDQR